MTNLEFVKLTCNAICNTFYPDDSTLGLMLFNESIEVASPAVAKDSRLIKIAIELVLGYVEDSRSENGISTDINEERVQKNIAIWCEKSGLDVSEYTDVVTIESGSNLW